MRGVLRTALGVAAGATAMFMLEPCARPRRVVSVVRRVLGSKKVVDRSLVAEVETRLEELTPRASSIHVSAEHGCVLLTGDVLTEERARIVRDVAEAAGVDSVVDLLTEQPPGEALVTVTAPPLATTATRSPALAALELGTGVALAIAGIKLRGAAGIALGAFGAVLLGAGLATAARPIARAARGSHGRGRPPGTSLATP